MRMLLMGPPGAGKGTQAKVLADKLGIPAVSTGDIFRANMARQTELGLEAKHYVDAGEYVPDDVTNRMVRARLTEPDAQKGFLSYFFDERIELRLIGRKPARECKRQAFFNNGAQVLQRNFARQSVIA